MERQLNAELKQIQFQVKKAMIQNKIETSTKNIINYIMETILELQTNNIITSLYSVLFVYKDFIEYSSLMQKLILSHINTKYEDKALRLVKIVLSNNKHPLCLFEVLYAQFLDNESIKLKNTLDLFDTKVEYAENIKEDDKFVKFYILFFDDLVGKVDFKKRCDNFLHKDSFVLLLKYTNYISGFLMHKNAFCKDINFELSIKADTIQTKENAQQEVDESHYLAELKYIFDDLTNNKCVFEYGDIVLDIINKVLEIDNLHYIKNKDHFIELSPEHDKLITTIITEENTNKKIIKEFFSINRFFIVPRFISLIKKITSTEILQHIASILDINILDQIIELNITILRHSTNNDISIFLRLYNRDNTFINIMPSFLNFCTDHENMIDSLFSLLAEKISSDFFLVCTTLRNILRSHKLNLQKNVIQRNIIVREMSHRILSKLVTYNMFNLIIKNYSNNGVVNELLLEMSKSIDEIQQDGVLIRNEILEDNFTNLQFFKFYINKIVIDMNFVSKVLNECKKKSKNQKKFYEILFLLEKYNKINIDVCSDLYNSDMCNNVLPNSLKYRIQYLYKRQEKGCCIDNEYYQDRFLCDLMLTLENGNKNCKEITEEIIRELINTSKKNTVIQYIENNIKSNDFKLKCGILQACTILLKNHTNTISLNFQKSVYDYLFVVYKKVNALIIINLLNSYILYTDDVVTEDVIEVIEYYIDTRKKKYRKDLKLLIGNFMAKKMFNVTNKIKQYYKFKIKTNKMEIIIKKN